MLTRTLTRAWRRCRQTGQGIDKYRLGSASYLSLVTGWRSEVQRCTGLAVRNVIRQLRPLRSATITINATPQTFPPQIDPERQAILDALSPGKSQALTK